MGRRGRPRKEEIFDAVAEITAPEETIHISHIEFCETGSDLFDLVGGGGLPWGKIVNIVGDNSTGKTLLASEIIAAAHKKYGEDLVWHYDDAEAGYSFDSKTIWGIDIVADDEIINKIQGGWTDFDVAIATPDMMGKVGRLGRVLGPRGLMPSPKAGTVVPAEDVARVINEAKAGRVEFRVDKTANLHIPIGKASFDEIKLYENMAALMEAVKKARPATSKGAYIKRVTLTTTMGPGIKVDPTQAQSMEMVE